MFPLVSLCVLVVGVLPVAPAEAKDSIKVTKATFAREVTEKFEAKGVTTDFYAHETVNILLQIKGRPKKGVIEGRWTFGGDEIGKAKLDVASVNKGVLFSFGADTFAKFNFTPGPDGLIIGNTYAVQILINGVSNGSYSFSVLPPKDALPSKVSKAYTSKVEGGPEVKVFAPTDTVFVSFLGDFGITSWIQAEWSVSGKLDPAGTRSLTLKENKKAVDGNFSFLPAGGWPKGPHSVKIILNDKTVGKYTFNVA